MSAGQVAERAHGVGGVVGVGEHGDGHRRERQPLVGVDLDRPGGALVVGPLAHPALVQAGRLGELGGGRAAASASASAR